MWSSLENILYYSYYRLNTFVWLPRPQTLNRVKFHDISTDFILKNTSMLILLVICLFMFVNAMKHLQIQIEYCSWARRYLNCTTGLNSTRTALMQMAPCYITFIQSVLLCKSLQISVRSCVPSHFCLRVLFAFGEVHNESKANLHTGYVNILQELCFHLLVPLNCFLYITVHCI